MPLFCHLDSARNDRGYSALNDDSIVNTASFLYLNLWMNEMTLKKNGRFLEKIKIKTCKFQKCFLFLHSHFINLFNSHIKLLY